MRCVTLDMTSFMFALSLAAFSAGLLGAAALSLPFADMLAAEPPAASTASAPFVAETKDVADLVALTKSHSTRPIGVLTRSFVT